MTVPPGIAQLYWAPRERKNAERNSAIPGNILRWADPVAGRPRPLSENARPGAGYAIPSVPRRCSTRTVSRPSWIISHWMFRSLCQNSAMVAIR